MAGYYQKMPSGKYRLFASGGTGPDGKRKRYTKVVSAKSDREAEKQLAKFVASVEKQEYIEPSKYTLEKFVKRWLRDYAEKNIGRKTLHRYRQMLDSRILPALGHLRLEQITPVHLLTFYANLQEEGIRLDGKPGKLSNQTILHHHRLISAILQDAVEWQVIASNPASRVKPPKVQKQEINCYDEDQLKALLEAASKEPLKHKVLVNLVVFSGLRRGEAMGLEWRDINFEKNTLTVRQSSQYIPGQGQFTKDPKTATSKRILSLPPFLIDMLKEYKREQNKQRLKLGDMWQNSDRVFTTWNGKPGHPEWPSQWFPKFIAKHKLPSLSFHGLRHVNATLLINSGLPLKSISGRLGHSNVQTSLDIYGHFLRSADKEAADKLEQVYQNINGNGKEDIKKGQA